MEKNKEYYEGLDKRGSEYKEWKKTQDESVETVEVVEIDNSNPFNKGVSYENFLKELGDKDLEKHLKSKKCSKQDIEWIKVELKQFKNK